MSLESNNVCFNCENLTDTITCSKHDLNVNLDNYCDDHNYKKSLNRLIKPRNASAAPGRLLGPNKRVTKSSSTLVPLG